MDFSLSDGIFILRLILDIIVIWALIYYGLKLIRNNSRTIQIVKGVLIIVIIKALAYFLGLNTLTYLLDNFLNWGVVALLILFQPEIRGMLEKVGKTSYLFASNVSEERVVGMVDAIVESCAAMSATKTGALITIQQTQSLQDYIETGIPLHSDVSSEILSTIFQYGTPLHDGAVIIQGVEIACAAAYFPPTNQDLPSKYGARHRAAVGISEITDSITIIVSEESGDISVALKGTLTKYHPEGLKRYLTNKLVISKEESAQSALLDPVYRTAKNLGINLPKKSEPVKQRSNDERIKPVEVVNLLEVKGDKDE
jgi:diadenylate cyclase